MSPVIKWDEALPSDDSVVAAKEVRAVWGSLREGLDESLEWDGTVPGQLRAGAAPSFITTETNIASLFESRASSAQKLAFASDTSRLWVLGIQATNTGKATYGGGPQLLEHKDQVSPGFVWLVGSGISTLVAPDGTSTITYHLNGLDSSDALVYETPPQVFVSSDNTDYVPITGLITGTKFAVHMRPIQGAAANVTIHWVSSGTSGI